MKNSILQILLVGAIVFFYGCSEDNFFAPESEYNDLETTSLKSAKKPAPKLIGTMELEFTFGEWPEEAVWVGTVDFEGYGEFGIRFFHLSPFKEYSQASPFLERFEIYDLENPNHVYLGGPDVGVTTLANKPPEPCKYRMNGEVDVANEPFEEWLERHVHMSGVITWQVISTPGGPVLVPETAPGILRIN